MKLTDMFIYSVKYLLTQKLRSWLTIIGIVIGVATVISLVSIGDGISGDINAQLSSFGSNNLMIVPVNVEASSSISSFTRGAAVGKLYEKDFEKIKNTQGVDMAGRLLLGRTSVQFKDKSITVTVRAGDANILNFYPDFFKIESGRLATDNDRGVAILGSAAANDLFGKDKVKVNNIIYIGGKPFRVVGILQKGGSSLSQDDDQAIYIPIKDGRELFKSSILEKEITMIYARVEEGADVNDVKANIEQQIDANHKVNADTRDYSVITSEFIMKTVGAITGTLSLFLLLISSVSAFVGGIGISNTMFMSVLDRTREIGVLKSLGAKRNEILMLFIMEAVIIGLIGGVIGAGIGIGVAELIKVFGVTTLISPVLITVALVASMVIGAVAGAVPAYNASNIPAIEALKY